MGEMSVLGKEGDTKIVWNADNEDEVESAEATFKELVEEKKFAAFSVGRGGRKDKQIKKFAPEAEAIILVPQIAGG